MNTRGSFFGQMPPVTKNLIIINFIVWLAMFVLPGRLGAGLEEPRRPALFQGFRFQSSAVGDIYVHALDRQFRAHIFQYVLVVDVRHDT